MMTLPLLVRSSRGDESIQRKAQTHDVSFRGLYFTVDEPFDPGSEIEFILTLPKEITMAGDVHIRCFARVVRVVPLEAHHGIAARIERYEFLSMPT